MLLLAGPPDDRAQHAEPPHMGRALYVFMTRDSPLGRPLSRLTLSRFKGMPRGVAGSTYEQPEALSYKAHAWDVYAGSAEPTECVT
jgi:hypothetical protein